MLDILVPILFHLNDARSDQCELCCSILTVLHVSVLLSVFVSFVHLLHTMYNCTDLLILSCNLFSARLGLMHIGVFILLLLSGERNFGRYMYRENQSDNLSIYTVYLYTQFIAYSKCKLSDSI